MAKSAGGDAWIDNGYYRDNSEGPDLPARSGNNKAYGNDGGPDYIYQILDEIFVEGAEYTLSVWVGIWMWRCPRRQRPDNAPTARRARLSG